MPSYRAKKAEALYRAYRISEALEAISEAEALVERSEERCWWAELHRLRGVFLATMCAEETEIEASLQAAIRTAKEQKAVSLGKRAGAIDAEYRHKKRAGREDVDFDYLFGNCFRFRWHAVWRHRTHVLRGCPRR